MSIGKCSGITSLIKYFIHNAFLQVKSSICKNLTNLSRQSPSEHFNTDLYFKLITVSIPSQMKLMKSVGIFEWNVSLNIFSSFADKKNTNPNIIIQEMQNYILKLHLALSYHEFEPAWLFTVSRAFISTWGFQIWQVL